MCSVTCKREKRDFFIQLIRPALWVSRDAGVGQPADYSRVVDGVTDAVKHDYLLSPLLQSISIVQHESLLSCSTSVFRR